MQNDGKKMGKIKNQKNFPLTKSTKMQEKTGGRAGKKRAIFRTNKDAVKEWFFAFRQLEQRPCGAAAGKQIICERRRQTLAITGEKGYPNKRKIIQYKVRGVFL
ncbi:MAG: hypothetical protein ACI3WR_07540 [Oscillospiraceae bacterium]